MFQSRCTLRAFSAAAALLLSASPGPVSADSYTSVTTDSADGFHFVVLSGGDRGSSINGSMDDYSRAKALRSGGAPLIYVRQNGASYVIRDAALLARADAIMAPQRAMGQRQAALGAQQAALGARQAALGAQQGRLGALQANATARQMGELGRQQGELGRSQAALGAQQGELGRRQGELGREQGRLAQIATAQLRTLVGEAIQRGLAQRVN